MKTYWLSLTQREQGLVIGAGSLLVVFILYIAVVIPAVAYRAEAGAALARASRLYESVALSAKTVRHAEAAPNRAKNQQPVRLTLTSTAREKGVTLNRIQPDTDQTLTLWIEGTSAPALYGWLSELEESHGMAPLKATIQKTGAAGLVRAQLQFREVAQ